MKKKQKGKKSVILKSAIFNYEQYFVNSNCIFKPEIT